MLGDGANHIPLNELGGDAAREPDVPGLVPLDAAEDRVGGRLLRQGTIGLERRSEDHANSGIESRGRGKVQPDIGLRRPVGGAERGTAAVPVLAWCAQWAWHAPLPAFLVLSACLV